MHSAGMPYRGGIRGKQKNQQLGSKEVFNLVDDTQHDGHSDNSTV